MLSAYTGTKSKKESGAGSKSREKTELALSHILSLLSRGDMGIVPLWSAPWDYASHPECHFEAWCWLQVRLCVRYFSPSPGYYHPDPTLDPEALVAVSARLGGGDTMLGKILPAV
jgi:hypothetical protein